MGLEIFARQNELQMRKHLPIYEYLYLGIKSVQQVISLPKIGPVTRIRI
jgi:hypothetical protein